MSTITATNLHGDTIRKTGGSLGVDIRVKNTSVYESDGGTSVTQNLVSCIAKATSKYDIGTNSSGNSFNISSTSDDGTGTFTLNFSNNFSSAGTVSSAQGNRAGVTGMRVNHVTSGEYATSSLGCHIAYSNGNGIDQDGMANIVFGDLA
tara:strand:- start:473 stop:919 length:447 start_codon:yes stop_codon:yes gene_type:complete